MFTRESPAGSPVECNKVAMASGMLACRAALADNGAVQPQE
jgi:hypothetical protein